MKRIFSISIIILGFVIVCYFLLHCVVRIDESSFAILKDNWNGRIIKLQSGYNIFWQGAIPGRALIYTYNRTYNEHIEVKFSIRRKGSKPVL